MYLCPRNYDLSRGGTFETAKAGTFHSVTAGTLIPLSAHYYNYLGFCEAIGRIKDVWNVVPVKIENNDEYESPLFQFRYEGNGLDGIIITAQHVEGEETYKFIREDNQKEISLDLISY